MTPVLSPNPLNMVPVSTGQLLVKMAAALGVGGGALYILMTNGVQEELIPQSQWIANLVPQGNPTVYLFMAFPPLPTSEAWGNYMSVGEINFYLQHPEITGGLTLKQLIANT